LTFNPSDILDRIAGRPTYLDRAAVTGLWDVLGADLEQKQQIIALFEVNI
jgi:hypothetical protein